MTRLCIAAAALLLVPVAGAQTCADRLDLGPVFSFNANDTSGVTDISADGEVIVGNAQLGTQPHPTTGQISRRAFRWTAATGVQDLGVFPGHSTLDETWATAVSADGSTVVGFAQDPSPGGGRYAFRWTAASGMQDLGTLGATGVWAYSTAYAVSADGSVVVGQSSDNVTLRPFRWTAATGMVPIGSTPVGQAGLAVAVSGDGAVVLHSEYSTGGPGIPVPGRAFRWTSTTGSVPLGSYDLVAMSADGEVVVGTVPTFTSSTAHRWTRATGWTPLAGLPSSSGATVYDVSADGRVVVGASTTIGPFGTLLIPARWTVEEGPTELSVVTGLPSTALVTAVSGDGTVLTGVDSGIGFRVRVSSLGETYCRPAVANSTSCAGVLLVAGDPTAATGGLQLTAELLPQNAAGFFLTSRAQGLAVGPGGSQGNLCLGGAIGRFVGPGQVQASGAAGRFALNVDLGALPSPTGPVAAAAGETWNFQAWYRDANPGPTSNFTDAVGVTLR